jgi:hypothetical protein
LRFLFLTCIANTTDCPQVRPILFGIVRLFPLQMPVRPLTRETPIGTSTSLVLVIGFADSTCTHSVVSHVHCLFSVAGPEFCLIFQTGFANPSLSSCVNGVVTSCFLAPPTASATTVQQPTTTSASPGHLYSSLAGANLLSMLSSWRPHNHSSCIIVFSSLGRLDRNWHCDWCCGRYCDCCHRDGDQRCKSCTHWCSIRRNEPLIELDGQVDQNSKKHTKFSR